MYQDLIDNGVNNFDIDAEPVGYLALTLSDTSLLPNCTVEDWGHFAGDLEFYWSYDAQQNAYADTTRILKVYGNTFVPFYHDSVYVPRGDTAAFTKYF